MQDSQDTDEPVVVVTTVDVHINPKADTSKHAWVNLGTVRIHDPVPPPGRDLLMTTFKCLIAGEMRRDWRDALTGEEVVQNA